MELKDLQSDLEALRELYGFLQCGGDTASNLVLGERSKVLLKNLLDGATKRVLETLKKTIAAAECGDCGTSCYSESEKCRALSEFQPCVSPNMLKGASDVIHNFVKEPSHHAFSSRKDDASKRLTTHEVISQPSRLSFSLDKPENRKKCCEFNKKCSMKQQSTNRISSKDSNQQGQRRDALGHCYQASGDERKLLERNEKNMKVVKSDKTMRESSISGFQGAPSIVGSVAGSSRFLASGDNLANQDIKKGEAVNNFSKDVDNLVEHIESHISALRFCSKLVNATKGAVPYGLANMTTSMCPIVQEKNRLVKRCELSQAFEPFSDRDELMLSGLENQRIGKKNDSNGSHQVSDKSANDLVDDVVSKRRRIQNKETGQTCNHIVRSNSRMNKKVGKWNVIGTIEAGGRKQSQTTGCCVHRLRVPIKQDDITKRPPMPVKMPYAISMSNGGKELTPTIAKLRPTIPSHSAGSKASVRPITDSKSPAHRILQEQKKGRMGILQNKILLPQQESEESTTASTGSSDSEVSSLLSQDSAISMCDGGNESTPTIATFRHAIPSHSAGSNASVRSIIEKKSLAHQILPEQRKSRMGILRNKILLHQQESEESTTASTDSSGSEVSSLLSKDSAASISRRFGHRVYEESSLSTSSDYRDVGETGRSYATRTHKLISPAKSEPDKAEGKSPGRLRRFKNKLGLIFHHHHHHHHHHGYDQDNSGDHSQDFYTKSRWTPLHNLFHNRNRHEAHDKLRKMTVNNVPVKHQVGHFHALVKGLMQHLRHSKKSNPSKGGRGWQPGNDQYGRRKGKVKQPRWWQMSMSQGGVKLPSRRRVKIGFMSKKPQLKVPKLR